MSLVTNLSTVTRHCEWAPHEFTTETSRTGWGRLGDRFLEWSRLGPAKTEWLAFELKPPPPKRAKWAEDRLNGRGRFHRQDVEGELDTLSVAEVDRARRRRILCGVAWIGLSVVVAERIRFASQKREPGWKQGNNTIDATDPFDQDHDKEYPLTLCEVELLHNASFQDLIRTIKNNSAPALGRCRDSFPNCDWINPTAPVARQGDSVANWTQAWLQNQKQIQDVVEQKLQLDVVLIGDSLVEHMTGKELGQQQTILKRDQDAFETLFTRQGGGSIDGLALGIGGDRCSNLLYRLQHGILTYTFQPKVWWVIVGTKDWELGMAPQSIVAGIITIVQSIRIIYPDATIVVNSLLPHQEPDGQNSIEQVNQLLGCFVKAQSIIDHDQELEYERKRTEPTTTAHRKRLLHFFNATSIFMERSQNGSYHVNPAYMMQGPENTIPNAHGEWLWGQKIVETVQQLQLDD